MRKVHHSRFSHRVLEEFGEMWKVFAHNLAESRRKNKRKAEDLEGFKENHQKEEAARKSRRRLEDLEGFKEKDRNGAANYKAKRRKEDLEGFKEKDRNGAANYKAKRKKEDLEGFKEKDRNGAAKHKAKKKDEDPQKFKQEQNKWNAKQRLDAENTYLKEVRLAAIFPCVCCHTLNFRQQVVEFTLKQAESIKEKAFAAHQKREVIITTSPEKSLEYLTATFHEIFYMDVISNTKYLTKHIMRYFTWMLCHIPNISQKHFMRYFIHCRREKV